MAIRIGITGGIGSGKSVVSRLLGLMGIPVYDSDTAAKVILTTNRFLQEQLSLLAGRNLFPGGILDKEALSSFLFANQENVARVNEVIHPLVKKDFREWVAQRTMHPFVGIESAILIEAGFESEIDFLVTVCAPRPLRIDRVMKRSGLTRAVIEQRMLVQLDDAAKCAKAHFVIINDGVTPLLPRLCELRELLSQKYDYLCSPERNS